MNWHLRYFMHNLLRDELAEALADLTGNLSCTEPYMADLTCQDSKSISWHDHKGIRVRADVATRLAGKTVFYDCAVVHPTSATLSPISSDWTLQTNMGRMQTV